MSLILIEKDNYPFELLDYPFESDFQKKRSVKARYLGDLDLKVQQHIRQTDKAVALKWMKYWKNVHTTEKEIIDMLTRLNNVALQNIENSNVKNIHVCKDNQYSNVVWIGKFVEHAAKEVLERVSNKIDEIESGIVEGFYELEYGAQNGVLPEHGRGEAAIIRLLCSQYPKVGFEAGLTRNVNNEGITCSGIFLRSNGSISERIDIREKFIMIEELRKSLLKDIK